MRLKEYNDEALHAVVDYVTGTATKVLLRTMDGEFWDDNCIISMVRCAVKINGRLGLGTCRPDKSCR